MTTSFTSMAHLNPLAAFRANPGGPFLFLFVLATPVWLIHSGVTRQDPFRFLRHRLGRFVLPGLVVVIVAGWMIRVAAGWY